MNSFDTFLQKYAHLPDVVDVLNRMKRGELEFSLEGSLTDQIQTHDKWIQQPPICPDIRAAAMDIFITGLDPLYPTAMECQQIESAIQTFEMVNGEYYIPSNAVLTIHCRCKQRLKDIRGIESWLNERFKYHKETIHEDGQGGIWITL